MLHFEKQHGFRPRYELLLADERAPDRHRVAAVPVSTATTLSATDDWLASRGGVGISPEGPAVGEP
jgi:hypothetical protein